MSSESGSAHRPGVGLERITDPDELITGLLCLLYSFGSTDLLKVALDDHLYDSSPTNDALEAVRLSHSNIIEEAMSQSHSHQPPDVPLLKQASARNWHPRPSSY